MARKSKIKDDFRNRVDLHRLTATQILTALRELYPGEPWVITAVGGTEERTAAPEGEERVR